MIIAFCDQCGRQRKVKRKQGFLALYVAPYSWWTTPIGNFCSSRCHATFITQNNLVCTPSLDLYAGISRKKKKTRADPPAEDPGRVRL